MLLTFFISANTLNGSRILRLISVFSIFYFIFYRLFFHFSTSLCHSLVPRIFIAAFAAPCSIRFVQQRKKCTRVRRNNVTSRLISQVHKKLTSHFLFLFSQEISHPSSLLFSLFRLSTQSYKKHFRDSP